MLTSSTLLFGERKKKDLDSTWVGVVHGAQIPVWRVLGWTFEPPNYKIPGETHPYADFSSWHPGMAQFVFADGSVKPIRNHIHIEVFRSLGTTGGREVVGKATF